MSELETQVAKINISNPRQANTYVFVMAEKVDATDSELYAVCELPMLNPAASTDCQRICEAIAAAMRRGYRSLVNENTFENTLAHINDELGKLAGLGKTHWVGKLNAIVAVKNGSTLYLSSTGKMTALLVRDNKFATITESETAKHPLKTFENLSVGTLRLDDLLIFSTTQLFNHISIDRMQNILSDALLGEAATEIIEILRDNAGPEVAFGSIFALQIEPGEEAEGEVDLANYITQPIVEDSQPRAQITVEQMEERYLAEENQQAMGRFGHWGGKIKHHAVRSLDALTKLSKRVPAPNIANLKSLASKTKPGLGLMTERFHRASNHLRPETCRRFSWQKKFFFVCAIIFLLALVVNIFVSRNQKNQAEQAQVFQTELTQMKQLGEEATASFLYNDMEKARDLVGQLTDKLNQYKNDTEHTAELTEVRKMLTELQNKLDNRTTVEPESVATLSESENLIVLPANLATENNRSIVSYNKSTGKVQDNILKSSESIVASSAVKDSLAAIYNGSELFAWDSTTGILSSPLDDRVPSRDNFGGMKVYPVNSRAYIVDKSNSRIMSYTLNPQGLSSPTVSVESDQLENAVDIAIDGNIFVALSNGSILKFQSGKQQDFNLSLSSPLSPNVKLYTQNDFVYLYVLDRDNNRILVIKKTGDDAGSLAAMYVNDNFNNLKDFAVDEKGKTIYVLNGNDLLEFDINF